MLDALGPKAHTDPVIARHLASLVTPALAACLVAATGCGALGTARAIDEADDLVASLPCAPDAPCSAGPKARYLIASAREYLAEAHRRAGHSDHAQAERFAILARRTAEDALRTLEVL